MIIIKWPLSDTILPVYFSVKCCCHCCCCCQCRHIDMSRMYHLSIYLSIYVCYLMVDCWTDFRYKNCTHTLYTYTHKNIMWSRMSVKARERERETRLAFIACTHIGHQPITRNSLGSSHYHSLFLSLLYFLTHILVHLLSLSLSLFLSFSSSTHTWWWSILIYYHHHQ